MFGVPSLTADIPSAVLSYSKVSVTGTAYTTDSTGALQTYVLTGSTGTLAYDPGTGAVSLAMTLSGNLQTSAGTATTSTAFGTYTGSAVVDTTKVRFSGSLDSSNRVSQFSSFAGAFFGGTEAGSAFEILSVDTSGSGNKVTVVGTLTASR